MRKFISTIFSVYCQGSLSYRVFSSMDCARYSLAFMELTFLKLGVPGHGKSVWDEDTRTESKKEKVKKIYKRGKIAGRKRGKR